MKEIQLLKEGQEGYGLLVETDAGLISNDLTINRNLGTISGRTFTKSLFAVLTPYILAIGS